MNSVIKRKLTFIRHVARSHGLLNDILSGTVSGTRRRGRSRKKLENYIKDIVETSMAGLLRNAQNRDNGRDSIVVTTTTGKP